MVSDDKIKCAEAYDEYVVKNNLAGRTLNFPEKYPNYNPKVIKTDYEDIDENTVKLITKNEQSNRKIIIDKEDYDRVKYCSCFINNTSGYPMICINGETLLLSRFLMDENNPKIYIDHVDGDLLNNKKNNLRQSNAQKNGQNKGKSGNYTSKYFGVHYDDRSKRYISQISKNGKVIFRKTGINEEEIAKLRDLFLMKHPELHYKKNFI